MNQMTRTLAFVIAASASVIGAVVTHVVTKPPVAVDVAHQQIGQPFYPGFTEPTKVTGVKVAAWNPSSGKVEEFEVRNENGRWTIPSHQGYPADDTDQLAKAAASAVGIIRGSLVSESAETFARMGLIDPLDGTAVQSADSTGTRVTLYTGDQEVADYIIGRRPGSEGSKSAALDEAAEEDSGKQEKEGTYYVRLPKENLVYLAEVKIDISTRFRDWIKKDLLDLSQFDLRKITVNRYSVDESKGTIAKGDVSELERATSSEPWKLDGLDESKEQVKAGVVSAMARALDELQIIDVERKPAPLVKYFTEGTADVITMLQIQPDLMEHGFFFGGEGNRLWANEGEILAGAQDGVTYVLQFGEVFTGSDLDVSVGTAAKDSTEPAKPADADKASTDAAATDKPAEGEDQSTSSNKRSRYAIVEAVFDPSLLGPEPTPPVKPTPPAAAAPAAPQTPEEKSAAPASETKPDAKPAAPATDKAKDKAEPSADQPAPAGDKPAESKPAADKPAEEKPAEEKPEAGCDDNAEQAAETAESKTTEPTAAAEQPAEGKAAAEQPADEAPKADAASAPKADAAPATEADGSDTPAAAKQPADGEAPADGKPVVRPKTPEDVYQEALKQYEQDLEAFEAKKKDYDQRLKAGQKKVDELNKRFAEWYYVISADLFEDLSVTREQLVEPKSADNAGNAPAGGAPLDLQGLNIPGLNLPGATPPESN